MFKCHEMSPCFMKIFCCLLVAFREVVSAHVSPEHIANKHLKAVYKTCFAVQWYLNKLNWLMKTSDILLNLLKCLVTFYAVFFIISAICFGAFGLEKFDGRMPFNFQTFVELPQCCSSYTAEQLANLTCVCVSFFINTWAFILLVQHTVWDYCLTITLFHILLSCLVMLDFPLNWTWWVCIGALLLVQIAIAESVVCCLMYKKKTSGKNQVSQAPIKSS